MSFDALVSEVTAPMLGTSFAGEELQERLLERLADATEGQRSTIIRHCQRFLVAEEDLIVRDLRLRWAGVQILRFALSIAAAERNNSFERALVDFNIREDFDYQVITTVMNAPHVGRRHAGGAQLRRQNAIGPDEPFDRQSQDVTLQRVGEHLAQLLSDHLLASHPFPHCRGTFYDKHDDRDGPAAGLILVA